MSAQKILWKEFRDISHPRTGLKQVNVELVDDNICRWKVYLMVIDPKSDYDGAYFEGQLNFPDEYPFKPPSFRFTPSIFHPNVYPDGRLCISILHQAGQEASDEPDELTWSPAQRVETVLLSILSLLEDPNVNSPANVDAGVMYRKQRDIYKQKVKSDVQRSRERIPSGFVMPTFEEISTAKEEQEPEDDWWEDDFYEDEEEDDFDEDDDDDIELERDDESDDSD
ncbi:SCF E2 ubiquitin-protein ligase catalytic subunit [Martiniozyma asiatica (nom. inval.)]|nr:SCF E2 ubiquitin-protein ligase catalytic subunit [Martiniozyma asiatica]